MNSEAVIDSVKKIVEEDPELNGCFDGKNRPGKQWLKLFLRRHPEISKRNSEVISKGRAAVTEETIRSWCQDFLRYCKEENIEDVLKDPSRMLNCDEIGMELNPTSGVILAPRNEKNVYEIANGNQKENMTVLCAYAANEKAVPPLILYPYKRLPAAISQTAPEEVALVRSDSGWMVSETFYEYVANVLHPWLVEQNVQFPVVFFIDGHKSHINLQLSDLCTKLQIHLYCFPPNATHIMQPCDVVIFRPLKSNWRRISRNHKQKTTAPITKFNFASLFYEAFQDSTNEESIKMAFKVCVLYPFHPDRIDYSKCISTRRNVMNQQSNNEHNLTSDELILNALQSQMPRNVLEMFRVSRIAETIPSKELVLYNIWQQLMDKCQRDDNVAFESNELTRHECEFLEAAGVLHEIQDTESLTVNCASSSSSLPKVEETIATAEKSTDESAIRVDVSAANLPCIISSKLSVLTPRSSNFRKHLHWPTIASNGRKKNVNEDRVYAITLSRFKQICAQKVQVKEDKENETKRRKEMRALAQKEKAAAKENAAKLRKMKKEKEETATKPKKKRVTRGKSKSPTEEKLSSLCLSCEDDM